MSEQLITEDGTWWDSDGENICLMHLNEQWPCWLTKEDLLSMIRYLETVQVYKEDIE